MTAVLGLDIGGSTTRAVRAEDGRCVAEAARAAPTSARSASPRRAASSTRCWPGSGPTTSPPSAPGPRAPTPPPPGPRCGELLAQAAARGRVQVVHDARLILAAADLDAGIAVIAGTGSAGWGRTPDGREARAGGFGYLLGDEGSGYWTAREAVRHVLHRADTGAAPDPLGTALLAACGVAAPVNLFDLFYARPERAFWAGHAGVVVRLAASDPVAAEILGRAADALASLATTVGARLDSTGPVVLGGGFAVHEPALRAAVADRLAAAGVPDVRVIPP